MRILLVSGSTREGSTNTAALATMSALAPLGIDAPRYRELAELPAFVPDAGSSSPPVQRLHAQLAQADGVLFSTPEYAGTLPGSLKNLLDWTVGTGDLWRKPVAWLSVAPRGRGDGAIATLASVLGYVEATIVEQACGRVTVPREAVGADGLIADPRLRARLVDHLTALASPAQASSL
jgi:NAD(P)H-dependent FMN reductase